MRWLGSGLLTDASLVRYSGQVPLVGNLREGPGHAEEATIYLSAVLGTPRDSPELDKGDGEAEVWASLLGLLSGGKWMDGGKNEPSH